MHLVALLIKQILATVPCQTVLEHDLPVLNAPSIKNNISFFTCEVTENIKSLTLETKQELPML